MFIATADPKRACLEDQTGAGAGHRRDMGGLAKMACGPGSDPESGRRTGYHLGEACPFRCQVAVLVEAAQGNRLDSFSARG